MKIVIISQNDLFVIPRNIEKILKMNDVIIEGLFVLNVKGALDNNKDLKLTARADPLSSSKTARSKLVRGVSL